jgi:hypothetical protein
MFGAQFGDDAAMLGIRHVTLALPFPALDGERPPERIGPRLKQRTVRRRG